MKIKNLELVNFRNYDKVNISLCDGMNIFIGDNAQGKTNILESIVILGLTKSHRLGNNPNIIKFGKKVSRIKGTVKKDNNIINKLEVQFRDKEKLLSINGTNIKKVSSYISNLNVIVFSPDDLDIIKGSPSIRRNLLNIQLSQISNTYLNTYNEYNKILKTRNEYLKILYSNSIADVKYLDVITERLIDKAFIIYKDRINYINYINENINVYYNKISGSGDLKICYEPNISIDYISDECVFKQYLKEKFTKNYTKELNYGMTLFGPHRDDFSFILNDLNLKLFGSQGQQKLAILSYKLSEIPIFKSISNSYPVLLLDDIFSELDIKKRNSLLKIIDKDIQCIITTTDLKNISKKNITNSVVFEVRNGKIERK